MSFPNVVYGDYGDEKITSTKKIGGLPLGARMVLPDGREYAHAYSGAAALSIGGAIVQKAVAGTSVNVAVAANAAIGATSLSLTMPATTLCTAIDQYAEGYVCVNDETGQGNTYKVKTSNTGLATANVTFGLYPNDPIIVALAAGTSQVTIRENPFYAALDRAAGTGSVGIPAGVPNVAVAASTYCWLQRKGTATLLAGGTLAVEGRPFACCTAEASFQAWNAQPISGTTGAGTALSPVEEAWGYTEVAAAASTEYFVGYLTLG